MGACPLARHLPAHADAPGPVARTVAVRHAGRGEIRSARIRDWACTTRLGLHDEIGPARARLGLHERDWACTTRLGLHERDWACTSEIGPARRDWACTSEGRGVRRTDSKSPSDGRLSRCVQLEGWRIGAPHDRVECTGAEQSGHGACYGATDVAEPLGSRWALDGVHLEFTRAGVSVLRCTLPLGTTCSHVERASQSKQKNTCHSYIIKTT